ncbi:hypothetical protein KZ483_15950 [Paenibacillus sp. sptzw28]|uniref:hypothetical protein n=1 Tax=Paenibacillus sp. sptzw28 TaxID=715179 RepID=UPI001C6EAA40|nr:hypothetical protein [Paenibacillus sp. sptzw28]QYR19418.1 hypothetical protein KZ483_15950 [Paenibacillus sp. sptzw28]
MIRAFGSRFCGTAIMAGGLLLLLASVLHPPAANPWSGMRVIPHIADSTVYWQFDHVLMLVAVFLLFTGLAAGSAILTGNGTASRAASWLFIASLTIWILVIAMELTLMPTIAQNWGRVPPKETAVLFTGIFAFGIMAGDFAMMLAWIAVMLIGLEMLQLGDVSRWLAMSGIVLGGLGAAGIAASLLLPNWSLPILLGTSGPAFLWVLIFGWSLFYKEH